MNDRSLAVLTAVLGFQSSAIVFLAFGLSRTRERLARIEQQLEDLLRPERFSREDNR